MSTVGLCSFTCAVVLHKFAVIASQAFAQRNIAQVNTTVLCWLVCQPLSASRIQHVGLVFLPGIFDDW